ncbi:MAG: DinB family protein [Planctomycetaceae bacterium]|nr:DinB family protein [Planctomycetaceae bacterium]
MSIAQQLLPEFDYETANTRKVLEQIPDDKIEWQAGPSFKSIGWNASHLAEIANWTAGVLLQDAWDARPEGGEPYHTPVLTTRAAILARFDEGVASGRRALEQIGDDAWPQPWSLLDFKQPLFTMPRAAVYRTFIINHLIHHRAHLIVYLRLNGINPPPMYGV